MPDAQTLNSVLNAYGVSASSVSGGGGINWGYWMANIIFGIIGMCAFMYGKKEKSFRPMLIGISLMFYPWFVTNAFWTIITGIGLTAALFYWRE